MQQARRNGTHGRSLAHADGRHRLWRDLDRRKLEREREFDGSRTDFLTGVRPVRHGETFERGFGGRYTGALPEERPLEPYATRRASPVQSCHALGSGCARACTEQSFTALVAMRADDETRVGLLAWRLMDAKRSRGWATHTNKTFSTQFDEIDLRAIARHSRNWLEQVVSEHFERRVRVKARWLPHIAPTRKAA